MTTSIITINYDGTTRINEESYYLHLEITVFNSLKTKLESFNTKIELSDECVNDSNNKKVLELVKKCRNKMEEKYSKIFTVELCGL